MRAMILSAGLGTRLRPLTDELPKPLMWLGDRPVLGHITERLKEAGIEAAVINTHHLAGAFRPSILAALGLEITVLTEREILGTAGGVRNAAAALGPGPIVVWNGDIVASIDVRGAALSHARGGALSTLVVAPRPRGEGTVGLGPEGEVVRLRGELFGPEVSGGDFMGAHVLSEELRGRLPLSGCLVGDVYLPALRAGERIGSSLYFGAWDDIGSPAAYLAANARWLREVAKLDCFKGPGSRVAPSIDVGGSVIGAGAVVEGEGALRDCVVWPGARARAPLSRAIVTTGGLIVKA